MAKPGPTVSFSSHNAWLALWLVDHSFWSCPKDQRSTKAKDAWEMKLIWYPYPTPSCLYNLPTVTQLLILHIACNGFHGFNDRDANSLSWKRKESWYPPSAQDTKSTQYLTYLTQQSCEWVVSLLYIWSLYNLSWSDSIPKLLKQTNK